MSVPVNEPQLTDGESAVYTLTQILTVAKGTPAGETHCTFVEDAYCAASGAIVPNEHTAELSITGMDEPVSEINVPPWAALEAGDTLDTDGAL